MGHKSEAEGNFSSRPVEMIEELEESIHNMGGSTARLFSMVLRDRHDLESMEGTLCRKVEELVQNLRSEFDKANCGAERSPVATTHILAMGRGNANQAEGRR